MTVTEVSLIAKLKADLLASMKARDTLRVATLRTMLSALDNATAVEVDTHYVPIEGMTPDVPRRELSEEQQLDILRAEMDGRRKAIAQYEQVGKVEVVTHLHAELAVFGDYLGEDA